MTECPQCHSQRVWKDGLRETARGPIQRWICRDCGYRFSETGNNTNVNTDFQHNLDTPLSFSDDSEHSEHLQKLQSLILRSGADKPVFCRVGASSNGAENLVEVETRTQEKAAGATRTDPTKPSIKGAIIEVAWRLKREGYSESSISNYPKFLELLVKRGANLYDPESVKDVIANQEGWRAATKIQAIYAYAFFALINKIPWTSPKYEQKRKLPFIPLENEIDALIARSGKKLAAILQLLKESGVRIGEALKIAWIDIDLDHNVIAINETEKSGNPRMLKISNKLAAMLNALPRKGQRVFEGTYYASIEQSLVNVRKTAAHVLQNPRLLNIHFHTFRHWKATMEYHKTKDPLHVMKLLGHKQITSTMLYTQLVSFESDDYHSAVANTVAEAQKLIETGFEYVCTHETLMLFRKRK